MQTAVIVPTLNEAENVETLLAQIEATGVPFSEVIFVDDGSHDGTREIVRELTNAHPVRLLAREGGERGLAGAIVAGANVCAADIVVVMDADLSHPPEKIAALVQPIVHNEADLVIGSRYIRGGDTPDWPLWRRVMSRAATLLAFPLTGVHDAMGGFFAVRREALLEYAGNATGFKIAFEMLVRSRRKLRVLEVPIVFRDRQRGKSKMSIGEATRFGFDWSRAVLRRMFQRPMETASLPARQSSPVTPK
ncbi:MAG: polyprenol monophosphomannose synthase [Verrucomicrobia bacterium]|nr:polyprenol monophosphomannose synthase [Verrucomicrobiota bacterium]